jgi:hypothetical protein
MNREALAAFSECLRGADEPMVILDVIRLTGPQGHFSGDGGPANEFRKNAAIALRSHILALPWGSVPVPRNWDGSTATLNCGEPVKREHHTAAVTATGKTVFDTTLSNDTLA